MSLLNVWVEPGRALVAVDTETKTEHGRRDSSKLVVLPAERMVLACRGNLYVLHAIVQPILGLAGGLDGVLELGLPELCNYIAAEQVGLGGNFAEAEVVIVGWSAREQRIVGHACVRGAQEPNFKLMRIDPWRLGPHAGWQKAPPLPDCEEHMEAIARTQVRYMRQNHPDCAIGGRLLIAAVSEDAISVRSVAHLG